MNLGELDNAIKQIRSQIKDRNPDNVEVVLINPSAKRASDICEYDLSIKVVAFEIYRPPRFNREWHKQVRILIPRY